MGDVKMRGLVTLKEILENTRKEGYAVGSFNFNGYEDAQGIINGAAEKNSPVILMASMGACKYIGLHQTVGMIKGMAASVDIPVCLHLDHATDMDYIKEAIKAGFSSVMIDASAEDYEINIQKSKEIVEFAKDYHCSVEAELGKVGGKEENIVVSDEKATFTQPSDVPRFVEETGIDALAIAFGSVHGFYKSEPKLDFERLAEIAKITDCPLVLHGGTGIPVEDFKKCVVSGISKINVGTEFKKTFTDTIRKMCNDLPEKEVDPRKYMGPVKDACAEVVKGKIDVFGSANKA
ncbi:class II fructose-bisphosphate aldolase [Anaerotignum propionicum]|uniref:Fructose-bisphosphate aldolase n=1 Tax=Anaerotignum propionicum DSM 1682 TaxID=991789 RepID=A0A0X1U6L9_ANAPI|nr:class II fructose-bisphosphate aldolase [Anaerotignum propionicum]AMJ40585.1 fructose-bisphosphate aldolase [Anaerotignum propionicum DSM 1682]MEA5057962.1 class II fructose-bisphosphate aldolase [Anaerotignum propionicum]SHE92417.1 fructose-bisphosphate aldolase, class II [[Clostridium] propionicum DSM 1682] [Anaerotignum propionicum DSM 1682]